jgi:hypothetical protein
MEEYEDLINLVYDDDENQNNSSNNIRDNLISYKKNVFFNNEKRYKNVKIEFYTTKHRGCNIINAYTGEKTNYKVGSKYEDLFFVVSNPVNNCKIMKNNETKLYYDTPESYERNHYIVLNDEVKKKWYEKYKKFIENKNIYI